jgi:hypothetical protein
MGKTGRSTGREQRAQGQLQLPLRVMAQESPWDAVVISGVAFAEEQLEAERAALCWTRYAHLADRAAMRSGHIPSSLVLGARRVEVKRLRVRSIDGHEVSLPSWRAWSGRNPLDERAFEQMQLGVFVTQVFDHRGRTSRVKHWQYLWSLGAAAHSARVSLAGIIEAIAEGRQPADLTVEALTRRIDLPLLWSACAHARIMNHSPKWPRSGGLDGGAQ